ncbi:hypothetical protein KKB06_00250 [Patescibacteria group bacterium]|nr:hypothetical protein [Patescibacteria group bacterium]
MEETIQNSLITPQQPKPKSQLFVFISIFLAMFVSGGGVYWWQSLEVEKNTQETNETIGQLQQQIIDLQNQIRQLQPTTQQIDQVEKWKLYTNHDYNFTFKYPEHYFITWEGTWGEVETKDFKSAIDISEYETAPGREYSGIRMIIGDFSGNLYSYAEERFNNYNSENLEDSKSETIIETTIDGLAAYIVGNNLYFTKEDKLYSINNGVNKQIFDKIISTFEFVE